MTDDESPHGTEDGRDAPLGDLADEIERRREGRTADADEAFTEMSVEEDVDAEDVWSQLDQDESAADVETMDSAPSPGEAIEETIGEPVDVEGEGDERVIPSRICHGCRYFGAPPEMACTHEGTEIREMVDVDHYRVVDCPIVGDEEFELEETE